MKTKALIIIIIVLIIVLVLYNSSSNGSGSSSSSGSGSSSSSGSGSSSSNGSGSSSSSGSGSSSSSGSGSSSSSGSGSGGSTGITLILAKYGDRYSTDNATDISTYIKNAINTQTTVTLSPSSIGISDPAPGINKMLLLQYSDGYKYSIPDMDGKSISFNPKPVYSGLMFVNDGKNSYAVGA